MEVSLTQPVRAHVHVCTPPLITSDLFKYGDILLPRGQLDVPDYLIKGAVLACMNGGHLFKMAQTQVTGVVGSLLDTLTLFAYPRRPYSLAFFANYQVSARTHTV